MTTIRDKFMERVDALDGHWFWRGGRMFYTGEGHYELPRRASWLLFHGGFIRGKSPQALAVKVTCGEPRCVRPEHLAFLSRGKNLPVEERFEAFFTRGEGGTCWLWEGAIIPTGYGDFNDQLGLGHQRAHRVAFFLAHGFWPKVVMHTCDVRSCVNPAHLRAGTYLENNRDMWAKGRANPCLKNLRFTVFCPHCSPLDPKNLEP